MLKLLRQISSGQYWKLLKKNALAKNVLLIDLNNMTSYLTWAAIIPDIKSEFSSFFTNDTNVFKWLELGDTKKWN